MRIYLLLLGSVLFFLASCAQQVPPTGGPKDVTPPSVVSTFPKNQTTNFREQVVELEFDEYVSVDNINQQLLITPEIEGIYTTKIKPKGARLLFDKPFKANTTYSLNFRNTFKDISERNPARNVKLVFSTGSTIDSLRVSGQVVDLQTNEPALDALVGLYRFSDTLQFSKNRPYYFAKADSSGQFEIENIAVGTYRLAALTDANNNLLYDAAKESIAFLRDSLVLTTNQQGIRLALRFIDTAPNRVVTQRGTSAYYTVGYAKGVKQVQVQFRSSADSLPYALLDEKQLQFYNVRNETDTVRAAVTVLDSADQRFNHEVKIKFRPRGRREEATRSAFTLKTIPADREEVETAFEYQINFTKPVLRTNYELIELLTDTTRKVPIGEQEWQWNPTRTQLSLRKEVNARREIRVSLPKGTFFSIENDTNQVSRTNHPIKDPENYGVIGGQVTGYRGGVIVQLVDENFKVVSTQSNKSRFRFEFVKPGKYYLRAIEDANNNGKWDAGNAERFELPERIVFNQSFPTLKQNFELDDQNLRFD
jgi:hypothetical protein